MAAKPPRLRRTPAEARQNILDAASHLLAQRGPDAIGLKDVARAAGVSHALVTHYFGTYDALVEAVFTAYVDRTRADVVARIGEISAGGPAAWIDVAARHLGDPLYGRLAAWGLLCDRDTGAADVTRRQQGLRTIADLIVARGGEDVVRDEVELAIVLVMSTLLGYQLAGRALWSSLGANATPARTAALQTRLADLLVATCPTAEAAAPAVVAPSAPISASRRRRSRGR